MNMHDVENIFGISLVVFVGLVLPLMYVNHRPTIKQVEHNGYKVIAKQYGFSYASVTVYKKVNCGWFYMWKFVKGYGGDYDDRVMYAYTFREMSDNELTNYI